MKKRRLAVGLLVLCGLIAVSGYGYWQWSEPTPPSYVTQPVKRGQIESTVLANGVLQAVKLVNVGAQASGQILSLPVALGDELHEGDLVAQIDSSTQKNRLREAQASLKSVDAQYAAKQAQIHQSQLAFQRQQRMLADNASSRADYETAEAQLAVDQAQLEELAAQREQAQINVDNAKVDLGYTTIRAPMDGTVVYTAVESGQTVNANQTTPTIIELAQLDKMTVKAKISEADVVKVKAGLPVYFTILGQPEHRYPATLRAVEPGPTSMNGDDADMSTSDSEAVYYNGLFDVDNPDHTLRIGMTAQVSIVLDQADDALIVPSQVLQRSPEGTQVPVLNGQGQKEMKPVEVGIDNRVNAQILSGLEADDQVIVGQALDQPGSGSGRRGRF
ncbi:efflux RND transporter periplasmic adaptor subunit [Terasakiispira papahanaumokuakeensis]|nr:efflux RND transporter periplasmic adaptor subunit [Terasakiispira papahanaumokuakeensis]